MKEVPEPASRRGLISNTDNARDRNTFVDPCQSGQEFAPALSCPKNSMVSQLPTRTRRGVANSAALPWAIVPIRDGARE